MVKQKRVSICPWKKVQRCTRSFYREKEKIEAACKALEEAAKGEDKDAIDARTKELAESAQKLGEKMYADMQAQQAAEGAAAGANPGGAEQQASSKKDDADDVVDADFKEVKDK